MALNMKTKAASAPTKEEVAEAAPAPTLLRCKLVNECSTYVTPEREVFYARDSEGNTKVYEVTPEQLARLLTYRDDWGRRFFRQTADEATDTKPDTTAKVIQDRGGKPEAKQYDESDPNEEEELDTGAMRLKDKDGNDAGVTV
jgi:hypothetical protein